MGATATAKRQDVADLMKQFVDGGIAAQQAIDSHAGSVNAAIAKAAPPARLEEKFFQIRVDSLRASTTNPRKRFEPAHLEDLAASIRERGVLQPLLVRPAATPKDARPGLSDVYEIVAGECRWRAATLAGLAHVPCIVRMLDDQAALDAQIVENLQRRDLTPLEEAAAFQARLKAAGDAGAKFGVADLAHKIGKAKRWVYDRLELLKLSDAAKRELDAGKISPGHAAELVRLDAAFQAKALAAIHEGEEWDDAPLTVRALRGWIDGEKRQIEWEKKRAAEEKAGHALANVTTRYQRPAAALARERRARAIAQARNEALRQIVSKVRTWDVRAAAIALAERTRFEGQKVCCRVLGLVPAKLQAAGGFDYRRALRRHIESADAAGVQRAMAALSLAPEDGFTAPSFTWNGKQELAALYAAGKKVGVDVKRLERDLAGEKKLDAKRLAKARAKVRTSAKRRAA